MILSDATLIGSVVIALATIIGLFSAIMTPIVKLNKSIQKLNDSITLLNSENEKKNQELGKISSIYQQHQIWLVTDKKRLDNLSRRMHKVDGEEGFVDNISREI